MRSWNHVFLFSGRAYVSRDGIQFGDELGRIDAEVELDLLKVGDFIVVRKMMARVRRVLSNGTVVCVLAKASAGRKARAVYL